MEPLKIFSKELAPKCISLRSRQLPLILDRLGDILSRNRSLTPCSENGDESHLTENLSEEPIQSERYNTKAQTMKLPRDLFNSTLYTEEELKEIPSLNGTRVQNKVSSIKINKENERKNVPQLSMFKAELGLDYCPKRMPDLFRQQARSYHKKADANATDGVIQGISSGILSKEALMNRHIQRNVSHFAIFDPATTALNLSTLQPSKAGFNIRKLISKSCKENLDWRLPSEFVQVKTKGPGINDNLIDFVDQKMKIQAETKRKFNPIEKKPNTRIRSLMNKARSMNREAEKQRMAATATDNKEKRLFRTFSSAINPSSKHSSERSFNKTGLDKPFQKKLSENSTNRQTEAKRMTVNKKDTEEDLPQTSYQSSASYRDIFYNILKKTYQKPKSTNSLSVFNRPALETGKVVPRPATQSTLSNVNSYVSAKGKSEKQLGNEGKKSQTSVNRPSMKDGPRTPFQKVRDSLLTKSAKATFSTISKTKQHTRLLLPKKKENTKGFSATTNPRVMVRRKVVKPKMNTISQKRNKSVRNLLKSPKLNKNVVKGYSKQAKKEGNILERHDSKIFSKTNKQAKTHDFNRQPSRNFFSYHGQNKENKMSYLKSSPQKEPNKSEKSRTIYKSFPKRNFHAQNCTIFEPIEEKVFHEFLNLCDASKKVGEVGRGMQSAKKALEDSCRCLNSKKPEKKKGLVCRIASMFNLGCGCDSKCPPRGCTKCGKF